MVMTVDVPDYTWNGSSYKADVPPYKEAGNEVMVPLRVVAPGPGLRSVLQLGRPDGYLAVF